MSEFNFRIIDLPDGNQVIRKDLRTPFNSLTPFEQAEYTYVENMLYAIEQQKKMERREEDRQRRIARNPFLKLACLCGMF